MKLPDENNIRIIETITDDYGTARKFSDGTMIVTQSYTTEISSWNAWGNIYTASLETPPDYPISFVELPYVSLTAIPVGTANAFLCTNSNPGTASHSPKVSLLRGTAITTSASFKINVIAIGKWK